MNLRNDSERKRALEDESKSEIVGNNLHYKDMFK